MDIKKINLDRKPLTGEQIKAKQNFRQILDGAKYSKPGIWKNPWFYGAIGLTSFASFTLLSANFESIESPKKRVFNSDEVEIQQPDTPAITNGKLVEKFEKINTQKVIYSNKHLNAPVLPDEKSLIISNINETTDNTKQQIRKVVGFPSIAGVTNGPIKLSLLQNAEIIESGCGFEISGYKINYFDGLKEVEQQLKGNTLSRELKDKLVNYNLGEMVFFTDLKGVDESGITHNLPSFNLRITKN